MLDQLAIRGKWYSPDKPHKKVSGMLKFVPGEEPVLELDGSLQDTILFDQRIVDWPIILGMSVQQEKITLYKCYWRTSHQGITRYSASLVLIGQHFKKVEDITFKRLRVTFTNLDEWYDRKWLELSHALTVPKGRTTVTALESEKVPLASSDIYPIHIISGHSANFSRNEAILSHKPFIQINLTSLQHIEYCQHFIAKIQNFLGLAMNKAPYTTSVSAQRGETKIRRGRVINDSIKIYFRPIIPYDAESIYANEMLFTLSDIRSQEDVLDNWLRRTENLEPVFTLYFAIQHSPFIYLETRFLYLAQAIETYHRRTYGGKYQDDETYLNGLYQSLISALPADLEEGFRISLIKGKFRYAHEFSLRKRLAMLLKEFQDSLPDGVFLNREMKEQFTTNVVEIRNHLTHYDDSTLTPKDDKRQMFYLEQRLSLLLQAIFFKEMGFSAEQTKACLQKSRAYQFIQAEANT